ncbi:MAG TPA: VTC domain-containing protein [Vicinamibacterales bacterium]
MIQELGRVGNWAQRVFGARTGSIPARFVPGEVDTSVEQKYVFGGMYADLLTSWLSANCDLDPEFPLGTVFSLYYDTPTLALCEEKRNSDYLKSKVRLRWYDAFDQMPSGEASDLVQCFFEVKSKIGSLRSKNRVALSMPRRHLLEDPFRRDEIIELPRRSGLDIADLPSALLPMLLVQYERARFVDTATGCRIALDTRIRAVAAHPHYVPARCPNQLSVGVLEVKGPERDFPESLGPLSGYVTKAAFSKYATCWEQILQPAGVRM